MQVYYTGDGDVVLEIAEASLVMSRAEAEEVFVEIGRCLQDMDVSGFQDPNIMEDDYVDG